MARYQIMAVGGVFDTEGNVTITPADVAAWGDYSGWMTQGNVPDQADPPAATPLEIVRAEKIAQTKVLRSAQFSVPLAYAARLWQADESSQARLASAVTTFGAGVPLPDGFVWRTADNVDVPMSFADLVALAGTMAARTYAIWQYSWQLKNALEVAADPSTVDITQGWPT